MLIFPAIDVYGGRVVRLLRGDYGKMKVYSDSAVETALRLMKEGAGRLHIVDLEGARTGTSPNFPVIAEIKKQTGLFCEVGGGIRSEEVLERYAEAGIDRMILGTAALGDPGFLDTAIGRYGDRIAVSVDARGGFVSVNGWTETSGVRAEDFCRELKEKGVKTVICTDISRDGAMKGANHGLYRRIGKTGLDVIASGGVSSAEDVRKLARAGVYGAIIGRAYYEGTLTVGEATEAACLQKE